MSGKIDTGYDGNNIAEDFFIPPCNIEEVDRSVFKLFDERLRFEVQSKDKKIRVPVVFAAGERFALTRRDSPLRDDNNALILPIISIVRNSIDQSSNLGGYGTAIANRDQDLYVIKRRLSKLDRGYQNLINKNRLKNQENVASRNNFLNNDAAPGKGAQPDAVASRRNKGNLSLFTNQSGELLANNINDNVYEIITIPYPEFFLVDYEITFWTQYFQESNQLIEHLMASYDGQDRGFALKTSHGYDLFGYVQSQISSNSNFSDYSSDERIIKHTIQMKVPAFLIAPDTPGLDSPFRKYYSAPSINFEINEIKTPSIKKDISPHNKRDLTLTPIESAEETLDRGVEVLHVEENSDGSFNRRYVKIKSQNQRKGETVYSSNSSKIIDNYFD